ncbi:hypothetical protein [Paenibacillus sp. HJGM_3]|uniref:hypothetical protein n=1 Tax=Paenibacillus sp. HJGM_3 TaxID=3379816 RepID=UPI00385C2262
MQKQTVYRIRYTIDGRVKAVHATEESAPDPEKETLAAWYVIVLGALAIMGWCSLWA